MNDAGTPGNVPLNDRLGPLPEAHWLWARGSRPYCDSYSADQMRAYAADQVAAERERCAAKLAQAEYLIAAWERDAVATDYYRDIADFRAERCR